MGKQYIVHKAVELDKVKKSLRPSEAQLRTEYICQPKYDGCNMVAVKSSHHSDDVALWSRTGEKVVSADHIKLALGFASFAPVGVYFGEYWHPTIDQPTVSGKFRDTKQQHTEPYFVIFDYVTLEEWEAGVSSLGYHDRTARLPKALGWIEEGAAPMFLAESQGYLCDQEMSTTEAANLMKKAGAYDGIILRKTDGTWTKGSLGTTGEVIKIKPTLTLDLRVCSVGETVGEKTGREVFTVVVELPNGNIQEVGSGVPFEREALPQSGDIVEIEALEYSKHGLLREPRFKGIRHDKAEADK